MDLSSPPDAMVLEAAGRPLQAVWRAAPPMPRLGQVRIRVAACGGIHMSRIPAFDYALLWGERRIAAVANLTRADGEAFMRLAAQIPLQVQTTPYPLAEANRALDDLRAGRLTGAAVLLP